MSRKRPQRALFPPPSDKPKAKGFLHTGSLVSRQVRGVGSDRGFADTRVLTRWDEICGSEIAGIARPVRVAYNREGFGATLTVICNGANAPEVQIRTTEIRERVNSCYGYNAIARVRVTQTDALGFAEAQTTFQPKEPETPVPVQGLPVGAIADDGLKQALEQLGRNIATRQKRGLK